MMKPEREYLSEMDIFKVISESKSRHFEPKIYPEKGMSPKNKETFTDSKSSNDKSTPPK